MPGPLLNRRSGRRRPDRPRRIIIREDDGPGPEFLNAPGQARRTVGAVIAQGVPVDARHHRRRCASRAQCRGTTTAGADRPESHPTTIDLDGLGSYRVVGNHPRGPEETIVVGLPTSDVDDTLLWVLVMFCIVGVIALVAAAAANAVIRRQFAPLSRVSAAARQVADLELDRGEVRLPSPIVKVDPAGAHTEIGQLGSALNRMVDRIAGALSARHASEMRVRQFVADASHELRTPLAAIRGYTELAQRKQDALPDDVAHAMSRSNPNRTHDPPRRGHAVARAPRHRTTAGARTGGPDPAVVDAASDAHIAGPEHSWSLDLPEEPIVVRGDEARLHQVLANLLANARTHTPAGTSVTTALSVDGDHAVLTVTDDGPGIPVWSTARGLPAVRARRLLALQA